MFLSFDILRQNKDLLNSINVYPMHDSDTGNNLINAIRLIDNCDISLCEKDLEICSKKMLESGTGCSGNILSLYVTGLYMNYSDNLTDMCKKAAQFAWDTMYEPVEGTILTAMKNVPERYDSVKYFTYQYIQNVYSDLMEGPDLLQVLKDNHTLDSGTLGFLFILCDIYRCMTGENIAPEINLNSPDHIVNSSVNDRYCVEINLISKEQELKQLLSKVGSELVYFASGDKIKIHIHTDNYLEVIDLCEKNGKIEKYKIEDMTNGNRRITTDQTDT